MNFFIFFPQPIFKLKLERQRRVRFDKKECSGWRETENFMKMSKNSSVLKKLRKWRNSEWINKRENDEKLVKTFVSKTEKHVKTLRVQ